VIELRITGQVRGGKNNMGVSKTGIHYPKKAFSVWSKAAIAEVVSQWRGEHYYDRNAQHDPVESEKAIWQFIYTPSDRRRRDVPAILDAVFHVLERAGVVSDDAIIKQLTFTTNPPDKLNAGITIRATYV
jgi:Holliday junction resolvase RusA-like endonuclease